MVQRCISHEELSPYFRTKTTIVTLSPSQWGVLVAANPHRVGLVIGATTGFGTGILPDTTTASGQGLPLTSAHPTERFCHSLDGYLCQAGWSGFSTGAEKITIVELILDHLPPNVECLQ